jgi:DNA-binding IclR family transcriptional regulator
VGSNSNKPWTVVEVLHQIQSSEQSVSDCLRKFQHEGFLEMTPEGRFRFAPKAPEMSNMVQELAKSYRERRVAIVELIYKKPQDAIQDFADAFRFRKDK